jgi:hypothetical protein
MRQLDSQDRILIRLPLSLKKNTCRLTYRPHFGNFEYDNLLADSKLLNDIGGQIKY